MANDMILAYDIGTSSVKTSLVSAGGRVIVSASHAYPTAHPKHGYAEQNPQDWWRGMCVTTNEVMQCPAAGPIAAIGISGHMMSCVAVDASGNALYPCMIHTDSRAAVQCGRLDAAIGKRAIYGMTGNILAARKPICKIMWLRDNERAIYNAAARFLHTKDYIAARLTGNIDTTDYSDACHSALIDINTLDYDAAFYREIGVDIAKMPTLHRGTDIIGTLSPQSAVQLGLPSGIPVIAGGGDGVCANVGTGVVRPGGAYCCLGTTAWIAQCVDAPVIDPLQRLFNLVSVDGQTCSVYGTTQSAGAAVDWTADILGETDMAAFNAAAAQVPAGSDGLVFLSLSGGGTLARIRFKRAGNVFRSVGAPHTRAYDACSTGRRGLCAEDHHRRSPRNAQYRQYAHHRRRRKIGAVGSRLLPRPVAFALIRWMWRRRTRRRSVSRWLPGSASACLRISVTQRSISASQTHVRRVKTLPRMIASMRYTANCIRAQRS